MTAVAIITARGGSKRIPGKNTKPFCGKPILQYSIEAAVGAGVFDEVMVSTDDADIAALAKRLGASVPFLRSAKTADDYATTDEVLAEVLAMYEARGRKFDRFCCLYPTAPFLTPKRLREAMALLDAHESVMPVVRYAYPPQRSVVLRNGRLLRAFPAYQNARSQDLEPLYHDCGQFYACRTDAFWREKTTDVADLAPLLLSENEAQDIDTCEDWAIAEEKFRRIHKLPCC